ncbi:MAG TPA: hypothetical protein VF018_14800 [Acidobacteriaceae bacterium]
MASRWPRVLCYGHDEMLLYTRKRILDREFLVERCENLAGLDRVLSRGPLDLVLLCHSVPDAECEAVIERVRAESTGVKVLVLHEAMPGICSVHSDASMENLEGPPALLHQIYALLGMAGENTPVLG